MSVWKLTPFVVMLTIVASALFPPIFMIVTPIMVILWLMSVRGRREARRRAQAEAEEDYVRRLILAAKAFK